MKNESVSLFFKEGGSDKVYNASLCEYKGLWSVLFKYGRRGSALTSGIKISGAAYAMAKKVYDKLIHEKTAKGYQVEGADPLVLMQAATAHKDTGVRLQLLNEVAHVYLEALFQDPDYCLQEKFDGRRRGLIKEGDEVTGTNRKGESTAVTAEIASDLRLIDEDITLDSEDLGAMARVFDLLYLVPGAQPSDWTQQPYSARYQKLTEIFASHTFQALKLVETAFTEQEKRALFARVKAAGGEGVVFKLLTAKYTAGRPNSGGTQLKFKFQATGSFIVTGVTVGKRSVSLNLFDGTAVGKVTIPPNHEVPAKGSVVEVQYLYCYKVGSLFQPVYLGERDDIMPKDCTAKQLKYKPEEEEV